MTNDNTDLGVDFSESVSDGRYFLIPVDELEKARLLHCKSFQERHPQSTGDRTTSFSFEIESSAEQLISRSFGRSEKSPHLTVAKRDLPQLNQANLFIYGKPSYGKTNLLMNLAIETTEYFSFYCDLAKITEPQDIENAFEADIQQLGASIKIPMEAQMLVDRGVCLFLLDNLDKATPQIQQSVVHFCNARTSQDNPRSPNRIAIASSLPKPKGYFENFDQVELAKWSYKKFSTYLELPDTTPKHFESRIGSFPIPPHFAQVIGAINRACKSPQFNLAQIMSFFVDELIQKLHSSFSSFTPWQLKDLVIALADSAEKDFEYHESELVSILSRCCESINIETKGLDFYRLWQALLEAEIIARSSISTYRFAYIPVHHYLIALSYFNKGYRWDSFFAQTATSYHWSPVSTYFLELLDAENRMTVARLMVSELEGYSTSTVVENLKNQISEIANLKVC